MLDTARFAFKEPSVEGNTATYPMRIERLVFSPSILVVRFRKVFPVRNGSW
jgi:hypothetical protein